MLFHYFKIAFRNLWKYKHQTLICIAGLGVGFTCFALATLWIRHEMNYDGFHKNAKQLFVVYTPSVMELDGYLRVDLYRLSPYLKGTFPEIKDAITLGSVKETVTIDGIDYPVSTITVDSSFFRMFDVKIIDGGYDFLIPGSNKLAITQKKARQLFGDQNPIGKSVNNGANEICAIVLEFPGNSNYAFDFIGAFNERRAGETIIELLSGIDVKAFEKKLYDHSFRINENNIINKMLMKPLTKMRYLDPTLSRDVKFQHVALISVSGLLVILCSLFNFLALFLSRFRIRQKELAMRLLCGASGGSLLAMLSVEFLLTLFFAAVLGCGLIQCLQKPFLTLSDISMNLSALYKEQFVYIGGVILVSLLIFWLILFFFRRMNLNVSIRRGNKNIFRRVSIIAQLFISIIIAFCTGVIMKQMHFLYHSDELGFSFLNRGSVQIWETAITGEGVLANQLKQIPEITESLDVGAMTDILSPWIERKMFVRAWDEKPVDKNEILMEWIYLAPVFSDFYDFRLVAGEMLTDDDPGSMVMINETSVKALGWHDPVGKTIDNYYTVKGVIKNVYYQAPTLASQPIIYTKPERSGSRLYSNPAPGQPARLQITLFKYQEGMWEACKQKIEQLLQKEYTDLYRYKVSNSEEEYSKFLKSEGILIRLLSFLTVICMLICVFGFYSLVSLTCEERRKSIAIRKINGATTDDIVAIFAKEYILLLFIGAAIAFSTGFFVMQRWLELYVKQTDIPAWIYLSILLIMAFVIVVCVGWQVYKASVENPAEAIKSE